jgi:hypothetical protein
VVSWVPHADISAATVRRVRTPGGNHFPKNKSTGNNARPSVEGIFLSFPFSTSFLNSSFTFMKFQKKKLDIVPRR